MSDNKYVCVVKLNNIPIGYYRKIEDGMDGNMRITDRLDRAKVINEPNTRKFPLVKKLVMLDCTFPDASIKYSGELWCIDPCNSWGRTHLSIFVPVLKKEEERLKPLLRPRYVVSSNDCIYSKEIIDYEGADQLIPFPTKFISSLSFDYELCTNGILSECNRIIRLWIEHLIEIDFIHSKELDRMYPQDVNWIHGLANDFLNKQQTEVDKQYFKHNLCRVANAIRREGIKNCNPFRLLEDNFWITA